MGAPAKTMLSSPCMCCRMTAGLSLRRPGHSKGMPVRAGFDRGGDAKRRGAKARMAAMTTEEEEAKVVSGEAASDAAHSRPALDDTRGAMEKHAESSSSSGSISSSSSNGSSAEAEGMDAGSQAPKLAALGLVLGIALIGGGGYLFKDQIRGFIDYFIEVVDTWGPLGYLAYGGVYTLLEILAVPAVPLTMTAGVIFGPVAGSIVVSVSATAAATIAFLIARYAARERVAALAAKSPKFSAIDRVIGRNGLKVVTLLRLSPLLPLALSNYLYGLTSVDLPSYVAGSWLGMLPGTIAYVTAGSYGRALIDNDEASLGGVKGWQVALGVAVTLAALLYCGRLAQQALDEAEAEEGTSP